MISRLPFPLEIRRRGKTFSLLFILFSSPPRKETRDINATGLFFNPKLSTFSFLSYQLRETRLIGRFKKKKKEIQTSSIFELCPRYQLLNILSNKIWCINFDVLTFPCIHIIHIYIYIDINWGINYLGSLWFSISKTYSEFIQRSVMERYKGRSLNRAVQLDDLILQRSDANNEIFFTYQWCPLRETQDASFKDTKETSYSSFIS